MRIILFSKFNAILRGALQKASHRVANRRRGSEKIRKMQRKISKIRKKREPLDEALIKKRNIFLPNVSTGFALCRDFFPTVCAALRSCASAAGVFAHGGLRRFAVLRFSCRGFRFPAIPRRSHAALRFPLYSFRLSPSGAKAAMIASVAGVISCLVSVLSEERKEKRRVSAESFAPGSV